MIRSHWPLIIAAGILLVIVAVCFGAALEKNNGQFVYVLDDPYIHMSIAKNLTQHGVWGITKHGFTSCSSSPLWTLTISGMYAVFGVNETGPLILNILIALGLLTLIHLLLRKYGVPPLLAFAALLITVLATPLATLVFTGLEHTFHVLYSILFMYFIANALAKDYNSPGDLAILGLSAAVLVATRYEGLFAITAACGLFLLRGRMTGAFAIGTGGIIPPVLYGLTSVSKGWFFLPNSVILKGNTPDIGSFRGLVSYFGENGIYRLITTPHLLVLVTAVVAVFIALYRQRKSIWDERLLLGAQFITVAFLHLQFADVGWFHRYEGYLMGMGIFTLFAAVGAELSGVSNLKKITGGAFGTFAAVILVCMGLLSFIPRAWSTVQVPQASNNIYEQQYNMGLFLHRYYESASIAANDVGAITFLADIRCLDLWGLGSIEVARAMRENRYSVQTLNSLATKKQVEIAVMYETFFYRTGGRPRSWIKVHEWWLENNVVCGSDAVAFYAVNPNAKDKLMQSLRDFGPHGLRRQRQ